MLLGLTVFTYVNRLQFVYKTPSKICKIYKNMQKFLPAQYHVSTSKHIQKVLYLCGKIVKTLYLSAFLNAGLERRLRRHKNIEKPLNKAVFCYSFAKPFAKLYMHKKSSLHG